VAILYPDRRELAKAVKRVLDHGHPIDGASEHGGSEAIYLTDPDGNGLELYRDRPRKTWTDEEGEAILKMPKKLDLGDLLEELGPS
jgi:catechol 2,3-dioxygenase